MHISPDHDPATLHTAFAAHGRLQIPDFLDADGAAQLWQLLQDNRDWYLSYNEGSENYESDLSEFEALQPLQQQRFMGRLYARAKDQFQYLFHQYYITEVMRRGENPGHPLHAVETLVNSDDFLAFMRTLTGSDEVARADCCASAYGPGHFLTLHDDRHASHDRVAAYVISMTRDWDENWGGYLAFYDDDGNVEEAFRPSYNTLNIFTVPKNHAVQMVAPFAGHRRTSILGWLQR